jgi:hypothetical protein
VVVGQIPLFVRAQKADLKRETLNHGLSICSVNFQSTDARKMFNVVHRSFMLCITMLQMLYKLGERTCKFVEQEPFELVRSESLKFTLFTTKGRLHFDADQKYFTAEAKLVFSIDR